MSYRRTQRKSVFSVDKPSEALYASNSTIVGRFPEDFGVVLIASHYGERGAHETLYVLTNILTMEAI